MPVLLNEIFGSALFFLVLGLVLGSFGNVLIVRLPKGESIMGRSHCPRCRKTLGFTELIPILSYILQSGRCRGCEKSISIRYPLVELGSGALFVLASVRHAFFPHALLLALALWLLLLIALIDAETQTISDLLSVPLVITGFIYGTATGFFPIFGPAIAAGVFGLQWILSRGRWVGSGDIILGVGIGALMGTAPMTLLWLWISYVGGAIVALILLVLRRAHLSSKLPFAPFLAGGAAVTVFFGGWMLEAWGIFL